MHPPLARVAFALGGDGPKTALATVRVLDVSGRAVRTLWSGTLARGGTAEATWDGRDRDGRRTGPGVYWVSLNSGTRVASARLVSW